ncbi:hypothetical protein GGU10DRAFT_337624 [Lentinula aff. detonsa]|uniref:Uncharacterized protein n=1 Tax=Lentinula aff. detonsa TaxID=2804958 RepID=A0AA38KKR3_9AGAR|nr:hypothetical protein GGU10DRAFT_337624 [Lentinula aff. detonsa]
MRILQVKVIRRLVIFVTRRYYVTASSTVLLPARYNWCKKQLPTVTSWYRGCGRGIGWWFTVATLLLLLPVLSVSFHVIPVIFPVKFFIVIFIRFQKQETMDRPFCCHPTELGGTSHCKGF